MATRIAARYNGFERARLLRRRAPIYFGLLATVGTAALLAGCVALVYLTGGTKGAFPHALYVPIAIAAYFFGFVGSLIAALLAGISVGPMMPLDVSSGEAQGTINWLYRLGFYLLAGSVFGTTATLLHRRGERLEEALRTVRVTQSSTLKAFSSVVETHDDATGEHCERVALNARTVGQALGLSRTELNQLYWAGILHDVGKVAVPTRILHKPGPLDEEEYELVKRHPSFGANLLRSISESFEPVAVGVECHHERWNGSGYPNRLQGEQIPLFGRILAIVDSFEAMTADRPYRAALPAEAAMNELHLEAGKGYDSHLTGLYDRLFRQGRIKVADRSELRVPPAEKQDPWLTLADH